MSEELAFLRAIAAAHDGEGNWDWTPRLIYADFLEERGRALTARFIRIGVELEGLTPRVSAWCDAISESENRMTGRYEIQCSGIVQPGYNRFMSDSVDYFNLTNKEAVKLGVPVREWSRENFPSLQRCRSNAEWAEKPPFEPDPESERYRELLAELVALEKHKPTSHGCKTESVYSYRGGMPHRVTVSTDTWEQGHNYILGLNPIDEVDLPGRHWEATELYAFCARWPTISFTATVMRPCSPEQANITSVVHGSWREDVVTFGPNRTKWVNK